MTRERRSAPNGYQAITPYFTVRGGDEFITFLVAAYNATVIALIRRLDGKIHHARLQIDDAILMLNDASDEYLEQTLQMYLYVESADVTFARAISAGATALMKPNDRSYGDRLAGVRDSWGNVWWIANSPPATVISHGNAKKPD